MYLYPTYTCALKFDGTLITPTLKNGKYTLVHMAAASWRPRELEDQKGMQPSGNLA